MFVKYSFKHYTYYLLTHNSISLKYNVTIQKSGYKQKQTATVFTSSLL